MPPRFVPNVNWVRAVVCPAVVFIATSADRGYQTDFWHHLARGREVAVAGRVAGVERFAFTVAGSTVRDANWLTQLAYFRLFEAGGMPLVQFANSCVLAAAAAALVWLCRRRGGSVAVAAGVGVFAFAGAWQTLLVRPQSVSLLLFVALLAILFESERRRWLLALPPVLMALWVNVHGGFPIGLVLLGAFLAATVAERCTQALRRRLGDRSAANDEDDDENARELPATLAAKGRRPADLPFARSGSLDHGGVRDALLVTRASRRCPVRSLFERLRVRVFSRTAPLGAGGPPVSPAAGHGRESHPFAAEFTRLSDTPPVQRDDALTVRGGAGMIRALSICLGASVLATLINPYGVRVYEYVFTLSTLASGRQIEEWLPPSMGLWVGRAWAASVVLLIVMLAFARRKPRARDLFVALCFLPLACSSVRMVPWWLLAASPLFASVLGMNVALWRSARAARGPSSLAPVLEGCCAASTVQGRGEGLIAGPSAIATAQQTPSAGERDDVWRRSRGALAMLVLIGACSILSTPWLEAYNPVMGSLRPSRRPEADLQAVVDVMRERPGGGSRVFTRLEWGEYLDWAGHPRFQTFMDGRIEIYPDDVWRQYHAVTSARADWEAILDGHRVDYLLLDAGYHADLLSQVRGSARWEPAGGAGPALLFARAGGGGALAGAASGASEGCPLRRGASPASSPQNEE